MGKRVFAFLVLIFILLFLAAGVAGQGMMGTFPLPKVVGMTQKEPAITIDVAPKFAIDNPHKRQAFRVLIRIADNPDNRVLSYSADCGGNAYSSQVEVDSRVYTKVFEMQVVANCLFVASIHRIENGKAKTYTVDYVAKIPEGG